MSNNPHGLKVGQVLFCVVDVYRGPARKYWVTVEKIGRKWAMFEGRRPDRISLKTLRLDGREYGSPGRCYLTEKEYHSEVEFTRCWRRIQLATRELGFRPHCGLDGLKQIAAILDIDLTEKESDA